MIICATSSIVPNVESELKPKLVQSTGHQVLGATTRPINLQSLILSLERIA